MPLERPTTGTDKMRKCFSGHSALSFHFSLYLWHQQLLQCDLTGAGFINSNQERVKFSDCLLCPAVKISISPINSNDCVFYFFFYFDDLVLMHAGEYSSAIGSVAV